MGEAGSRAWSGWWRPVARPSLVLMEAVSRARPEVLGGSLIRGCKDCDGGDLDSACIVTGYGLGVWRRVLKGHGRASARSDPPGSLHR